MNHLIYLSTPAHTFSDAELHALLTQARAKNEALGLTGVLFYGPGHFLQLLEGDAPTLATLYERIAQDTRHHSLVKLADKEVEGRSFGDWFMAFHPFDSALFQYVQGFLPLADVDLQGKGLSHADLMLLDMLRAHLLGGEPLK